MLCHALPCFAMLCQSNPQHALGVVEITLDISVIECLPLISTPHVQFLKRYNLWIKELSLFSILEGNKIEVVNSNTFKDLQSLAIL